MLMHKKFERRDIRDRAAAVTGKAAVQGLGQSRDLLGMVQRSGLGEMALTGKL